MIDRRRHDQLLVDAGSEVITQESRDSKLVRIGSRLGVWGLVGGFGLMTAFTLGAPVSLGAAIGLMGVGLLISGTGITLASATAARRVSRDRRLLKAASLIGVPTGALVAVLGATSLFQWGPLVSVVNAVTPTAFILGMVMIVLLVVAFVSQWLGDREP